MFEALRISIPVFAMVGFGWLLRRTGMLTEPARAFLSRFVYLFCLPVMIFLGVADKDFRTLLNWPVVAVCLLACGLTAAAMWLTFRRLPGRLRGPVVTGAYVANLSYLGFPLSKSAFGQEGLAYAAVINVFILTAVIVTGVAILSAGQAKRPSLLRQVFGTLTNPVVLAAVFGLGTSLALKEWGLQSAVNDSPLLAGVGDVIVRSLRMVGDMGGALALIAVGSALEGKHLTGRWGLLLLNAAAKLTVLPGLTLLACWLLFPSMPHAARGTAVLLMACPMSVGLYVISRQLDVDSDYLAALLVLTTALAVASTPLWLWAIL